MPLGYTSDHPNVFCSNRPIEARGVWCIVKPAHPEKQIPFAIRQRGEISRWIEVHGVYSSEASENALPAQTSRHTALCEVMGH